MLGGNTKKSNPKEILLTKTKSSEKPISDNITQNSQ